MAQRNTPTLDKLSKEQIRQVALARHAARKLEDQPAAYIAPPDPPAPEPVVVPAPVEAPVPAPVVALVLEPEGAYGTLRGFFKGEDFVAGLTPASGPNPAYSTPVTPRDTFKAWLRGREGVSACDTRMSRDPVRFGAELEDRLFMAWQAGFAEGRAVS